ncbi:MAG: MFS transporter [Desulfobacteraceae bacterium]|jgi:MFS family permease|nr:MFS transporter [Desulfobacteraceae bacterium]
MIRVIKPFIALLIATTSLTMGTGLMNSLLSINMRLQDYSDQIIGLVMSANYLGILLGVYFCQKIVQQVGHIRSFAVFAALITSVSLVHGLYMSAWLWAVLRICSGLCVTGLFMVIESWLNEKVEPAFRGRLLSIYMTLVYLGIGSGQFLLNVGDVQDQTIFMIAAILFALCLVPISITRAVNPQPLEVPHYNVIKLFQLAPLSMVGSFIAGLTNGSFYAMGPMFGLDIGLAVPQVSLFMSVTIWAGLLFQYPVGLVSDRLDRLTVLSALGFLVMLVSIGIAVLGRAGLGVLIPLTVCFGIVFTIYPVAMSRAQDNIGKEDIVPVSAALILFYGIGACFGPITASFIISKIGPYGLYYFTAGCGGTLGIIVWGLRNKLPRNFENQVPYIPIPKTSPVVSTIDPRGEHED